MSNQGKTLRWPEKGYPYFRLCQNPKGWTVRLVEINLIHNHNYGSTEKFIRLTKLNFAPIYSERPRYAKNKAKALAVAMRYEPWIIAHRIGTND